MVAIGVGAIALVTTEFLPVGLLPQIANDLAITQGQTGLMITIPGVVAACSALLTIGLTNPLIAAMCSGCCSACLSFPTRLSPAQMVCRYCCWAGLCWVLQSVAFGQLAFRSVHGYGLTQWEKRHPSFFQALRLAPLPASQRERCSVHYLAGA